MKFNFYRYPEGTSLQQRMFLLSLYVVATSALLLLVKDLFWRNSWVSGSLELFALALSLVCYYFSKRKKSIDVLSVMLVIFLFPMVSLGCILGKGGLSASNMMMFVVVFIIMIGTVPRKHLTILSIYGWLAILAVAFAEFNNPDIRSNYKDVDQLISSDLMIFTISGMAYFLILELTRFYKIERKANRLKNHQLKEKNDQIEAQAQSLREMNEFKTKLFAILGHDMMSPLQGLSSVLDLIRHKLSSPEEIEQMLPALASKVNNTTEVINNLFDWSRISLKDELLHYEEFILRSMIDRIIENVTTLYTEKNVEISNNVAHDIQIIGDASLIETIIRNLVRNAIKYSNSDGNVTISYCDENSYHCITVADRGTGMEPEIINQLFKFDVESKPGTNGEVGKGLGLFLCKEFVHAHGGEIGATSAINEGSEFTFSIPHLTIPNKLPDQIY